ncbi:MAG: hypothetical protein EYC70_02010 [Planctomycetota bacterium]|nr:MAG: hypothetical protein EYC70_02010 [Planctomycetota bacterium]
MKTLSLLPRVVALGAAAALAWALVPGRSDASPPSWRPTAAAGVAYLQQSPSAAWTSAVGGSSRNHLPNSVMPNGTVGQVCSVDTTDPPPAQCSTTTATNQRCSAHCDNMQRCSAYAATAGGTDALCSALGGNGRRCSVLQPVIQGAGQSQCSAFGGIPGTRIQCSIMMPGNNQACSAENPARFQANQCSTFPSGPVGGFHQCSVLNGGVNTKNYCSVGNAVQPGFVPKQCSTFAPNSNCSVRPGSRGFCTVFAPAPAGTCSVFAAPSTCSVIGGPNGVLCRWP